MLKNPSMVARIAVGKLVGFVFGLIGFVAMPYLLPDVDIMPRLGVLFWYPTVGAVIAAFGIFTQHPVLRLPLPWWFRAPLIGAWMNFVLTLFAFDLMAAFMQAMFGPAGALQSPFWFVLEGALIGLVIGFVATRLGGEGPATADA